MGALVQQTRETERLREHADQLEIKLQVAIKKEAERDRQTDIQKRQISEQFQQLEMRAGENQRLQVKIAELNNDLRNLTKNHEDEIVACTQLAQKTTKEKVDIIFRQIGMLRSLALEQATKNQMKIMEEINLLQSMVDSASKDNENYRVRMNQAQQEYSRLLAFMEECRAAANQFHDAQLKQAELEGVIDQQQKMFKSLKKKDKEGWFSPLFRLFSWYEKTRKYNIRKVLYFI